MKFHTFLISLGFTEREALVYVALLEYGDLSLSSLSQKTRIHRVGLYEILPQMVEGHFLSEISLGKRKAYRACDPGKLEVLFESKRVEFEKNITKLKKMYARKKKRPVITFREGASGVRETFDDLALTVPKDGVFYRYSSQVGNNPETRSDLYFEMRDKKKFGRYVITGAVKGKNKKPDLDRNMKVIPTKTDLFDDDISLLIYEDRVAFVDYENNMTFTITSERIAQFQRKLFMFLFKRL